MYYSQRTHNCGVLNKDDVGKDVTLNGWVHRIRNHGGIIFIDIRDRYGKTQVVINLDLAEYQKDIVSSIHLEYCLAITGKVCFRDKEAINPNLSTGEIEVHASHITILSQSDVLPFMVEDQYTQANEDLRLKYRYIDLRSGAMQYNIQLRHKVMQSARTYLNAQDFFEIETPTLIRSTPEGARDFLVPSRIKAGTFYALPQSPQLYKQILMISGMDKYYQFARCYRDEDARGDRQPEHTQIDIERSFVTPEDIYVLIEGLVHTVFSECLQIDIPTPFVRFDYQHTMNLYGTDKPDLRIDLVLQDFSEIASTLEFEVFERALAIHSDKSHYMNGTVKVLKVPHAASKISRKDIEQLEQTAKTFGAKGLAWSKYTCAKNDSDMQFSGGIAKFLNNRQKEIENALHLQADDLLLFGADSWNVACTALGAVRTEVAQMLSLIKTKDAEGNRNFRFVWVTDFPLFEWNKNLDTWSPAHHMFTMPQPEYLETLETNPGEVTGQLYDLVCNGVELASGSIRIHNMEIQQKIFDIIGMPREEAKSRFGFLLEALKYGAPPHGGIAPGLDRLLMLMTGVHTIRDVMGFPKNTLARSPMDESPNIVSAEQIQELHLSIVDERPTNSE